VSNNSLELTLDEFQEVVARMGNAYIEGGWTPAPLETDGPNEGPRPLELLLDDWLASTLYPSLIEASNKKITEECAASSVKKGRMKAKLKQLKKTLRAEVVDVDDEGSMQFSDPNTTVMNK